MMMCVCVIKSLAAQERGSAVGLPTFKKLKILYVKISALVNICAIVKHNFNTLNSALGPISTKVKVKIFKFYQILISGVHGPQIMY